MTSVLFVFIKLCHPWTCQTFAIQSCEKNIKMYLLKKRYLVDNAYIIIKND